jgi:hypothetical protein
MAALAVVFLSSSLIARPVAGQHRVPYEAVPQSQTETDERSPVLAGLLQAALPPLPLGYLYAGSFARGLIPMGVMVVGTSVFLSEGVQVFDWTGEGASETLLWVGFAMTLGGYVFGIVDAANVARNRNARVRAGGAALRLVPAPSGVGLAVTIPTR